MSITAKIIATILMMGIGNYLCFIGAKHTDGPAWKWAVPFLIAAVVVVVGLHFILF